MKYAMVNQSGGIEIRQDNSLILPIGSKPLTDVEYEQLLTGEYSIVNDSIVPIIPSQAQIDAENLRKKNNILSHAREVRDKVLARLNGIQQDLEWNKSRGVFTAAQVDSQIDGIMTAKIALKDITIHPTIVSATTENETKVALKDRYAQLFAALYAVSPYSCTAFNGLDA